MNKIERERESQMENYRASNEFLTGICNWPKMGINYRKHLSCFGDTGDHSNIMRNLSKDCQTVDEFMVKK